MKKQRKLRVSEGLVILLLALCSDASMVMSAKVFNSDQAVHLVEKALLPRGKDEVLLYVWGPIEAGTKIRGMKETVLTSPAKGYVIYIDDDPTANLFHPVRYAFVYSDTGEIIEMDATSPPFNFEDYQIIETLIGNVLQSVENRRAPLPKTKVKSPKLPFTRWAVLMNGGLNSNYNQARYWNDLSNIYITLNWVYGYADENIIVLCSDGLDPAPDQFNGQNSDPDLDGDGDDDIMYSCILVNVDMVFAQLKSQLTSEDQLFIFTTDHGDATVGWNTHFCLWNNERLTDGHFAELLDSLPQCEIVCTFEPCHSGGFLDDLVVPPGPRVVSSACRHDEVSYAMRPHYEYDEYVFYWTAAVKGEDAYGNPVDADYNVDGIVTMDEAFRYAVGHDTRPEHPQYGDYPPEIGKEISLDLIIALRDAVYDGHGGPLTTVTPYLVIGNVEVPSGETLTIMPNVEIYFASDFKIVANGTLHANGEMYNPIKLFYENIPHKGMALLTELRLQNGGEFKPGK